MSTGMSRNDRSHSTSAGAPVQLSSDKGAREESSRLVDKTRSAPCGERRRKPRICVPFHVRVSGVNRQGEEFNIETVLDNVSGEGLYLRMLPSVVEGTKLLIALKLDTESFMGPTLPRAIVEGVVLRTEAKSGGVCGIAVRFDRVRFT